MGDGAHGATLVLASVTMIASLRPLTRRLVNDEFPAPFKGMWSLVVLADDGVAVCYHTLAMARLVRGRGCRGYW